MGIFCSLLHVVSVNPPFYVIVGYLRRIWAKKGVEIIMAVNKGMFIMKFHKMEQRDGVLKAGFQIVDKKPLIVKQHNSKMDFQKEDLKTIPDCCMPDL